MSKKLVFLIILCVFTIDGMVYSQTRSAFTGDLSRFHTELTTYMGPNLNEEQSANLNAFLARWDSAAFNNENMTRIVDISSQLSSRQIRVQPHFNDFLITLNYFVVYKREAE